MSKVRLSAIGVIFGFIWICAPAISNGQDRITLYSILKHRGEPRLFCMNFRSSTSLNKPCYFRYGALYAGDDLDWLESPAVKGNRSVIKDLGLMDWGQTLNIPAVAPLPRLQPGERRSVTIDASGADGADGAPGERGSDGVDGDGIFRPKALHTTNIRTTQRPARPKHDGKPRVDPMFVKAVVGHMYVIHIVNETEDFYVLFRVAEIERGSKCTISWLEVPTPSTEVVRDQK